MKTITVSDLHGRNTWKNINPKEYDKIIFLGDYVDSFVIPDSDILDNLLDIIEFKKAFSDKVILLWGNHELQYVFQYHLFGCSGFRPQMYPALHEVFTTNKELFQVAFEVEKEYKYIWTHAGIHKGWFDHSFKHSNLYNLSEELEEEFTDNPNNSIFDIGHLRGGYKNVGGPFWVDIRLLREKPLQGYHQIVGHNQISDIKQLDFDEFTSVTFTDCLATIEKFYKLTIY